MNLLKLQFNIVAKSQMKVKLAIVMLLIFCGKIMHAQVEISELELFNSNEMLQLRMVADFSTIFSNKDDETYFPANLSLYKDGLKTEFKIEVRTRGNTRRSSEICSFAPLRLRFSDENTLDSQFEGQKAIKLVTHCKKAAVNEQNTIIEYLVYRAFNILTDSSFRVRPAIINYVNEDRKPDSVQRFAFFIERGTHLAERLNGIEIDTLNLHPNRLNPFSITLMDLFQYMIGNTDYSAYEMHNVILVADKQQKLPPIAIPYDFDWSGIVSAFYAEPNPILNTKSVDERVYRGFKKDIEIININILRFNQKKEEIYALFNDFELLRPSERKRILKYLDEFYKIINDPDLVKIEFINNARIMHN